MPLCGGARDYSRNGRSVGQHFGVRPRDAPLVALGRRRNRAERLREVGPDGAVLRGRRARRFDAVLSRCRAAGRPGSLTRGAGHCALECVDSVRSRGWSFHCGGALAGWP
eukprot:Amastigsp_a678818_9.p3 type:complete len:110 gc:universal Amastigsp_a678818_9:931-602(-)